MSLQLLRQVQKQTLLKFTKRKSIMRGYAMHNTLPTLKVKVTIRGQRSSHFFLVTKKTIVAIVIKLHAKGHNNEMIRV